VTFGTTKIDIGIDDDAVAARAVAGMLPTRARRVLDDGREPISGGSHHHTSVNATLR
jgi:hypothetical protein